VRPPCENIYNAEDDVEWSGVEWSASCCEAHLEGGDVLGVLLGELLGVGLALEAHGGVVPGGAAAALGVAEQVEIESKV